MKKRMLKVECPKCHHSFYLLRETMLTDDPGSKDFERLKNGIWFDHVCSSCRTLFRIPQPLLYYAPKKGFCLILSGQERIEPVDDAKTIRVRTPEQFIFAWNTLQLGLEFPQMIRIRQRLEEQGKYGYYPFDYDKKTKSVFFRGNEELLAFVIHTG